MHATWQIYLVWTDLTQHPYKLPFSAIIFLTAGTAWSADEYEPQEPQILASQAQDRRSLLENEKTLGMSLTLLKALTKDMREHPPENPQ